MATQFISGIPQNSNTNTNWDSFFSTQNTDRPLNEGAYNEAKRRAAAASARPIGVVYDAIAEDYIKQYESFNNNSAKTRTMNERRNGLLARNNVPSPSPGYTSPQPATNAYSQPSYPAQGMLGQATASAQPSLSPTDAITNLYRNVLGRDPDATGLSYWSNLFYAPNADKNKVYQDFLYAAGQYGATGNSQYGTYDQAIANYGGALSSNGGSITDDIFMNTLGRAPTQQEMAQWESRLSTGGSNAVQQAYSDFVNSYKSSPGFKNLSWADASRIYAQQGGAGGGGYSPGQPGGGNITSGIGSSLPGYNFVPVAGVTQATVNPDARNVSGDELVSNQMNNIMASNSPLLQRANARAMESANGRGLLNSSIAAEAGTAAMLDKAYEIGSQQAGVYNNVLNRNQDNSQQSRLVNADAANKLIMQNLDHNNKVALLNIEANYKTLMQANSDAADMFTSILQQIYGVSTNSSMDAASKAATITYLQNQLVNGMNVIGSISGIPLTDIFDTLE